MQWAIYFFPGQFVENVKCANGNIRRELKRVVGGLLNAITQYIIVSSQDSLPKEYNLNKPLKHVLQKSTSPCIYYIQHTMYPCALKCENVSIECNVYARSVKRICQRHEIFKYMYGELYLYIGCVLKSNLIIT